MTMVENQPPRTTGGFVSAPGEEPARRRPRASRGSSPMGPTAQHRQRRSVPCGHGEEGGHVTHPPGMCRTPAGLWRTSPVRVPRRGVPCDGGSLDARAGARGGDNGAHGAPGAPDGREVEPAGDRAPRRPATRVAPAHAPGCGRLGGGHAAGATPRAVTGRGPAGFAGGRPAQGPPGGAGARLGRRTPPRPVAQCAATAARSRTPARHVWPWAQRPA